MSAHSDIAADAATIAFEIQADAAAVEYRDQNGDDWGDPIGAILGEIRRGNEYTSGERRSKVERRTIQVLADSANATWGGLATVRQGGEFRLAADDDQIWAVDPDRGSVRSIGGIHEIDLIRTSPRDGVMPGREIRVRT